MAPTGHVLIQIAQLIHFLSFINALFPHQLIACCGHTEIHPQHARHMLMLTFALGFPM